MILQRRTRKSLLKRVASVSLCLAISVSMVAAFLTPLISSPSLVKADNTSPQNTDIFTGQFIPAYLGAAYDPSEAYKQMAGMDVYVFAYDSWGKVVNNFTYHTQIKADGSFQAAGLPNASHYGVCVPPRYDASNSFRAPFSPDGIQAAFAYSQADWPSKVTPPQDQVNSRAPFIDPDLVGNPCRVFLTSSRTVDISNHVNIFPLVPNAVISVLLNDAKSGAVINDSYNAQRPYEIYAQRIAINIGGASDSQKLLVNGPVIRGRSTPYVKDGAVTANATIFQSYAPPGMYAVTYWRPDSSDPEKTTTYLNYDGHSTLGTPYNGLGFEEVADPKFAHNGDQVRTWQNLSTRSATATGSGGQTYWDASPAPINIWGIISADKGGFSYAQAGVSTQINVSTNAGDPGPRSMNADPYDTNTFRQCGGLTDATTASYGIYVYTSTCNSTFTSQKNYTFSTTLSVKPPTNFEDISQIAVNVSGYDGPARRDISLTSKAPAAAAGHAMYRGSPLVDAQVDFVVNDKTYTNVATTDGSGLFTISSEYFTDDPYTKYQILIHPTGAAILGLPSVVAYTLDGSTLVSPKSHLNQLGTLALDDSLPANTRMLSWLSLPNLFDKVHIPQVLAASHTDPTTLKDEGIDFYFDQDSLKNSGYWDFFTTNQYSVLTAQIGRPTDTGFLEFKPGDGDQVFSYVKTLTDGSGDNAHIIGVELKSNQAVAHTGQLYQRAVTDSHPNATFPLTVVLKSKRTSSAQSCSDGNVCVQGQFASNRQDGQPEPPGALGVSDWPVTITAVNASQNKYEYRYEDLQVSPNYSIGASTSCGGPSSPIDVPGMAVSLLCNSLNAVQTLIYKTVNTVADHFFTVDPIGLPLVKDYWNLIRNVVNGFSVFILLFAGIAILLRYEPKTFSLQSALTNLIIAIVLVNFSILVIQLGIDIANVLSAGGYYLLSQVFNSGKASANTGLFVALQQMGPLSLALGAGVLSGTFAFAMPLLIIGIVVGCLLLYALFRVVADYLVRLAVLVICVVVAPLAFAARVLPATKSYFGKWRDLLIGTLASQVVFALTLGLAVGLIQRASAATNLFNNLILYGFAVAMFYMTFKLPQMTAKNMGAGLTANWLAFAGKQISRAGKFAVGTALTVAAPELAPLAGSQLLLGKERYAKGIQASAQAHAEDRFLAENKLPGLDRGQKAMRRIRQTTGWDVDQHNKQVQAAELEEKGEKQATEEILNIRSRLLRTNFSAAAQQQRYDALKEREYKDSDAMAGALISGKFTAARDNINILQSPYNVDLDYYNPETGRLEAEMGDVDLTPGAARSIYQASLEDKVLNKIPVDDNHLESRHAKQYILEQLEAAKVNGHRIGTSTEFSNFYDNFTYTDKDGHVLRDGSGNVVQGAEAWKAWYKDTGIYADKVEAPDLLGETYKLLALDPTTKGENPGWGQELRRANNQALSGIADRAIIHPRQTSQYQIPPLPAALAGSTPAQLATLFGTSGVITQPPPTISGRDADKARQWVDIIRLAYEHFQRNPNTPLAPNTSPTLSSYTNAVLGLKTLHYS